jgi:hypothetical protein
MHRFFIRFIGIFIITTIFTLPTVCQKPLVGVVNQSVINLKAKPTFTSEMSSQALMGTQVRILNSVSGWLYLITPEGYKAWTTDESIKIMSAKEYKSWQTAPKLIVTTYFSVLLSQPTESADIVSDVVLGNILRYEGVSGIYYKVFLPDGRKAFLRKYNANPLNQWLASRRPSGANIISVAKHFMGFPYLWGGTSVKGMDCSGFTKTCFFMNGVILRRDASQQAQFGESIDISGDFSKLQPADLLFFGTVKNNKKHIIHVAIYIGNGEFIHSSGMVRISSFNPKSKYFDEFNTNRLLSAKRIISRIDLDSGIVSIKKHPLYQ